MRTLLVTLIFSFAAGHASETVPLGLTAITEDVRAGSISVDGQTFHVVATPPSRLSLAGQGEFAPRTPDGLKRALENHGKRLVAATNAGLFHDDFSPVGLHVEMGVAYSPLEEADGEGNFYWKPNAVFWIEDGVAGLTPTPAWKGRSVDLAVQSGPALVIDGELHPGFRPGSSSRKLRSGVGICDGEVMLVRSEGKVNFHAFASVFRDTLGCDDALFLDGTISGLWAEGLPGTRRGFEYSGFLYVSE